MFESVAKKRVLITGASSGIGAAIARCFAEHGARVGIHYSRSEAQASALAEEIRKDAAQVRVFQANLLEAAGRNSLVPAFVEAFGGIDVLVNNAGAISEYTHFSDLPLDEWDRAFELHVKAPFCLSRDAYSAMIAQRWGRLINISSVAIKFASAKSLHYSASKAALEAVTRGFARDGAQHNVLANVIRCGLIDTPMRTKLANYDEAAYENRRRLVPLGRAGLPVEVARLVLFLASSGGDFITGECMSVSGGD
jgi:3-oxoacyl-[acyl-carrier protein] reductase